MCLWKQTTIKSCLFSDGTSFLLKSSHKFYKKHRTTLHHIPANKIKVKLLIVTSILPQPCNWCKHCSSPFPRLQASSECHRCFTSSPAVWDQIVLPATQYRWTHPWLIYERKVRPPHTTAKTFPTMKLVTNYTAWWTEAHVCEQLAQGHYLAVHRDGIKPWTTGSPVQHATATPPSTSK